MTCNRLPDAVQHFRRMAGGPGDAPIDVEGGRAALKGLLGPIWITPRDGYLVAKMGLNAQPPWDLLFVVAGARFGIFRQRVGLTNG